ncbi:MAG TPA: hypothetical protein VFN55_05260 [Solirubrobacteraceae bacterium]|nr:hypothetical protein [Solirubrobacteraceae bacterium]
MSTVTLSSPRPRRPAPPVRHAEARSAVASRLHLVPHGAGWALAHPDGELVYAASGLDGRRRCLEFARDHGVAALIS